MAKKKSEPPGIRINQRYEVVVVGGQDWSAIKEHPDNPKVGDVDAIDESMDENGWYGAVTVQESTGFIVAGNHRWRTAIARGAEEVPVIWLDCDDETALKILLGDNKLADLGVYDEEKLDAALAQLPTLRGTGFGLAAVQAEEEAADAAADEESEPEDEAPVPDDKYEPSFGVMLVVGTEEAQRTLYETLSTMTGDEEVLGGLDIQMRVVAV